MRTNVGMERILTRILELSEISPEIVNEVERIKGELNERDKILSNYGKIESGNEEEEEEYSYKWLENEKEEREESDNFKEMYEKLKKDYIARFFTSPSEIKEETKQDVVRDGDEQTIDELYKRVER